jgi:hypothetical protein
VLQIKQAEKDDEAFSITGTEPRIGFDPRGVVLDSGRYAGAPYIEFTVQGKRLRIYHNHGKVRIGLGSGRTFYTVNSIEKREIEIKLSLEKKEKEVRYVLTRIPV